MVEKRKQSVFDPQTGQTQTFHVTSIRDKVRKKQPQTIVTTPDKPNSDKK